MRAMLAVALLIVWTAAISQLLSPTLNKSSRAQQNNGHSTNQPTAADKSEIKPPAIVVNVIQPSETEDQQREKRQEREEKATFERWNSISTIVIAIFTFVLAVSTIALWWDTRKSSRAAWKAANVAERALVDLERPYIFLDLHERVFENVVVTLGGQRSINFSSSRTPIKYGLINRGRTPAFLTDFCQRLVSGEVPPPIDPNDPDVEGVVSLKGQDVGSDPYPCKIDFLIAEMKLDSLYLIGFIRYRDIFQRKHITGFCAKYAVAENRFALIGGDEYNYTKDEVNSPS
jgi:hypothetical protein